MSGIKKEEDLTSILQEAVLDDFAVDRLRNRLEDNAYMSHAIQDLARCLCVELMENEYGISFR